MAIDSRQKRQSTANLLVWSYADGVNPTGTIDQSERQASAHIYSGIAASASVAAVKDLIQLGVIAFSR